MRSSTVKTGLGITTALAASLAFLPGPAPAQALFHEGAPGLFHEGQRTAGVATVKDIPPPASGKTITVGPGKDFDNIQDAADAAQPGDNVAITPGTYDGGLTINNDGDDGKFITFYGDGGQAVITGEGGGDDGLLQIGEHSWQRFINVTSKDSSGFAVRANGGHDLSFSGFEVDGSQDGGLVLYGVSNILVDGCDIHGTNAEGTSADGEAMSLGEGSSNIDVSHCKVHDNGEEGIDVKYDDDAKAKIHDNVVSNNRGPNIYVDSSSNVEVYNNVTTGTKEESKAGIALAVEHWSDSRTLNNVKIYNNVSYGNAQAGISFWKETDGTMSNVQIVNNTFYDNGAGSISFDADVEGDNLLRNNIFGEGDVSNDGFTSDHNVAGDPGFVDPAGGDFHLKADSEAVNAGSADSAPAFDLENHPRPAGSAVDIGAYEQ
ncbi:right-handed parallel beta-helix repeat-containing protein [Luteipulveratus mongoliensis]|uniref:Right handed beta helix domain-containing protein n=1 Tax=Luteipulveratus mongoliensis TaxID=571913 RepID=A0A0K1JNG3_9MICO|nr:right-handed parallel beta-helix repeat-containing protein [Luteipulveratus mongoliensis]AKU18247.1 hypothetical protein VV02_24320 [Luteipulveratus mongoliensis]